MARLARAVFPRHPHRVTTALLAAGEDEEMSRRLRRAETTGSPNFTSFLYDGDALVADLASRSATTNILLSTRTRIEG